MIDLPRFRCVVVLALVGLLLVAPVRAVAQAGGGVAGQGPMPATEPRQGVAGARVFGAATAPVRLSTARSYFAPGQRVPVRVEHSEPGGVELLLTDFIGRSTSARVLVGPMGGGQATAGVSAGGAGVGSGVTVGVTGGVTAGGAASGEVDLAEVFAPQLRLPGTYTLSAVRPGETDRYAILGTPLVIQVRRDMRRSASPGPMVTRIAPLQYARIHTSLGEMTVGFYYDTAPITVETVQRLMHEGFYEGLTFHRVEPGFIVQTGDPLGDGTGGPGFTIDAEFSDRQHLEGVLSMARITDAEEVPGLAPRSEFADTAGSQFFISLDYATTRQLDRRFTAFGRVVEGLEVLRAIGAVETTPRTFRPVVPVVIHRVEVRDVTPDSNPYARLRVVDTGLPGGAAEAPMAPLGPNQR